MSTPNKFAFLLKPSANSYYYQDSSGLIQIVSSPGNPYTYKLKSDLENWQDLRIAWGRDGVKLGVFRSMSSEAVFTFDGADICRKVWNEQGFDGYLEFEIHVRDDSSWNYSLLFAGMVDFRSQPKDDLITFTAKIAEGGVYSMLDNKGGTDFTIPIDRSDAVQVAVDGPQLAAAYNYASITGVVNTVPPNRYYQAIPLVGIEKKGAYSVGEQKDVKLIDMGSPLGPVWSIDSAEHNNYLHKADISEVVNFKFNNEVFYKNNVGNSINFHLEIHILKATDTNATPILLDTVYNDTATPVTPGNEKHAILNFTTPNYVVQDGDRLYIVAYVFGYGAGGTAGGAVATYGQQNIVMNSAFRIAATPTEGYRYFTALSKLVAKMSGNSISVVSPFLSTPSTISIDSRPYQVILTSPFALRGLYTTTTGAPYVPFLRLNFDEMMRDALGRWPIGMGVDAAGQIVFPTYAQIFDDTAVIADLGEFAEVTMSTAEEFVFTQVKTGQETQTYDELNGLDEFNKENTYVLPLRLTEFEERSFVSPYRMDIYGIEQARTNIGNFTTADTESDGDVFLLDIDTSTTVINTTRRGGTTFTGFKLRRPNTVFNTSGVISPATIYNISLSGGRALRRLGPLIHSTLFKQNGQNIAYTLSKKNNDLISNIGSGSISEKADIPVSGLGAMLFQPVIFTCRVKVPLTVTALMQTRPFGVFTGTYKGKTIRGFVMDVSCKPADNEAQEWRLLASPTCDLTQFYPH